MLRMVSEPQNLLKMYQTKGTRENEAKTTDNQSTGGKILRMNVSHQFYADNWFSGGHTA